MVIFALSLTSILAVIGLLYTFGQVLAQRRELQTAADAASLRGSWSVLQELGTTTPSDSSVSTAVTSFATQNGTPSSGVTADYVDGVGKPLATPTTVGAGTVPARARGVRVNVSATQPSILPGFVKILQTVIQDTATSTARPTSSPTSMSLVIPVAVSSTDVLAALAAEPALPYDLFAHYVGPSATQAPTLNFANEIPPAPGYGPPAINEQYWSDGGHTGPWLLTTGSVDIAASPGAATTSELGTTATYAVANTLLAGETVTVTGCSVGGYNGTNLVVASANASSFTVVLSTANLSVGTGAQVNVTYFDSIAQGLHANAARQNPVALYALVMVPVYDPLASTATTLNIVGFARFKFRDTDISATSARGTFIPYATAAYGTPVGPVAPNFGAALVGILS